MNALSPRLFTFDNTYVRDLEGFYVRWKPAPAPSPVLVRINPTLACELGADPATLTSPSGVEILAGNRIPPGAEPIAQAYAGHQFGEFSPRLGDGRALLLGEVIDTQGQRCDLAFKGSGRTPFSRRGDGKCALGPALREYLVSEAMHAFGIPTTRSLAVIATGEMVLREQALPGAILTRVAASHVRIGTFEFFAAHGAPQQVRPLANYVIQRHYPELLDSPQPYLDLLAAVLERQAALIARWLGVGFIHGVMNTDNMSISGQTIDYGPCAFMETYDPATVFSSIDHYGRYAYGNQAHMAQWNLARFAETLLPLIDHEMDRAVSHVTMVLDTFQAKFDSHWLAVMREKLGLDPTGHAVDDRQLAADFLSLLQTARLDFTNAFRALHGAACGYPERLDRLLGDDAAFRAWRSRWQARQPHRETALLTAMGRANPWIIPRNHRVEEVLEAAVEHMDLAPFDRLLEVLQNPFEERAEAVAYTEPAPDEVAASYQTFCGT